MMGKKRKLSRHPALAQGKRRGGPPQGDNQKQKSGASPRAGNGKKAEPLPPTQRPTIPFSPDDRILLVGEGDLSFAASLVRHHKCRNVTATVLERSTEELLEKYPHAQANIAIIEGPSPTPSLSDDPRMTAKNESEHRGDETSEGRVEAEEEEEKLEEIKKPVAPSAKPPAKPKGHNNALGHRILYNVDATKMTAFLHRSTRQPLMDRIFFNFPHVGGKSTDVNRQVRYNQELLVGFFRSAERSLRPGGTIVVTLFEGEPYTLWNVKDLGRHCGLAVQRSFRFQPEAYPGYHHARTMGVVRSRKGEVGGGWKGEDRLARSYIFVRKGEGEEVSGKRKRRKSEEEEEEENDESE